MLLYELKLQEYLIKKEKMIIRKRVQKKFIN